MQPLGELWVLEGEWLQRDGVGCGQTTAAQGVLAVPLA